MPPNMLGHARLKAALAARAVATVLVLMALVPRQAVADELAAKPEAPALSLQGGAPPGAQLTAPPAGDPPATPPASLPPAQTQAPTPQQPPPEAPQEVDKNNVHSIGVTLSFSSGAGFAYRRQWGPTSVQVSAFAVVTDRGNATLLSGGALAAYRLHTWHGATRGLLPATSALRLVGGISYFLNRNVNNDTVAFGSSVGDTVCVAPSGCATIVTTNSSYLNGGAGLGFEFGAINRPGISMTLDVVLTAAFKDNTFSFLLPLPQLAVLYNW